MAAESEPRTVHTKETSLQEEKGCPVTSDVCQVTKDWPSNPHEFVEGGLTGWATAFGAWIGSTSAFLLLTVGLVSGSLHDRGYFYHLMITGSLLQSLSLFLLSFSKPKQYYQIFFSQGLGLGMAFGLTYIPGIAIISHHFRRRRTLVMTFIAIGTSLGAIIHPIVLNNLLNGPLGFANGVRVSAGLISLLLLTACLCMRTRLDPPATPANYIVASRKCIHDLPFVLMMTAGFIFQISFYYPLFFFQLDSIKHGVSVKFSFYSLLILNGSSCLGRFTSGFIAAFTGVPNLMIMSSFSCGLLIFGMIGLSSLASVVVLGVVYGYVSGVCNAMGPPLMALLTPDLSELGWVQWCRFLLHMLTRYPGTPICGALLTTSYIWWIPAVFSGVSRYYFLQNSRQLSTT
ncbi:MFS general substrate transporter [Suillus hirtellus]|nr:MFS general substrate transporter [Suillus hirtellus]